METERRDDIDRRIAEAEEAVRAARRALSDLRRARPPEDLADHVLHGPAGAEVRLSALFGRKDDLLVVHNMGSGCPYCTLWADGFAGILPHLADRAAFAVVTPDPPEPAARFAASRGWRFRLLSDVAGAFTRAAGFADTDGSPLPGVSAFRRGPDGAIRQVARASFGPGDEFCSLWHLFALLPGGAGSWEPRFTYS